MRGMGKRGMSHGLFLLCLLVLCMRSPILCPAVWDGWQRFVQQRFAKKMAADSLVRSKENLRGLLLICVRGLLMVNLRGACSPGLLRRVVTTLYPDAQIKLEGSNRDGTALHGISDFDVWIDTKVALAREDRRQLFDKLLNEGGYGCCIKPRHDGIGRKAMKFQIQESEDDDPINVDVVCVNMDHDIGLDEHDFPSFTRSPSRKKARLRATEHVRSCPKSAAAVLMMKAFTLDGKRSLIPGYFLNHFARRICEHTAHTSSTLFYTMVQHFLSFCELQETADWSAYPVPEWHGFSLPADDSFEDTPIWFPGRASGRCDRLRNLVGFVEGLR